MEAIQKHVGHLQKVAADISSRRQALGDSEIDGPQAQLSSIEDPSMLFIDPSAFLPSLSDDAVAEGEAQSSIASSALREGGGSLASALLDSLFHDSLQRASTSANLLQQQLETVNSLSAASSTSKLHSGEAVALVRAHDDNNDDNDGDSTYGDDRLGNDGNGNGSAPTFSSNDLMKEYLSALQQRAIQAESLTTNVASVLKEEPSGCTVQLLYEELVALRAREAVAERRRLQAGFDMAANRGNQSNTVALAAGRVAPVAATTTAHQNASSTLSSSTAQLLRLQKDNETLRTELQSARTQIEHLKVAEVPSYISSHAASSMTADQRTANTSVVIEAQRQIAHFQQQLLASLSTIFGFSIAIADGHEDALNVNTPTSTPVRLAFNTLAKSGNNSNPIIIETSAGTARFIATNEDDTDNATTDDAAASTAVFPYALLEGPQMSSAAFTSVAKTHGLLKPAQLLALHTLLTAIAESNERALVALTQAAISDRTKSVAAEERSALWELKLLEFVSREEFLRKGISGVEDGTFAGSIVMPAKADSNSIQQAHQQKQTAAAAAAALELQQQQQKAAAEASARALEEQTRKEAEETKARAEAEEAAKQTAVEAQIEVDDNQDQSQATESNIPSSATDSHIVTGVKRSRSPTTAQDKSEINQDTANTTLADTADNERAEDADEEAVVIKRGPRTETFSSGSSTAGIAQQTSSRSTANNNDTDDVVESLPSSRINPSRSGTAQQPVRRLVGNEDNESGPETASEIARIWGSAGASVAAMATQPTAVAFESDSLSAAPAETMKPAVHAPPVPIGEDVTNEENEEEEESEEVDGGLGDNWFDN